VTNLYISTINIQYYDVNQNIFFKQGSTLIKNQAQLSATGLFKIHEIKELIQEETNKLLFFHNFYQHAIRVEKIQIRQTRTRLESKTRLFISFFYLPYMSNYFG